MAFYGVVSMLFLHIRAAYKPGTHRQILLVGEDQEGSIAQLILVQHALQLLTGLNDTIAIVAVDDEDDTLGVLEVVPPERTDLVLTTDIPHGKGDVLVLDGLDVEALGAKISAGTLGCRPFAVKGLKRGSLKSR